MVLNLSIFIFILIFLSPETPSPTAIAAVDPHFEVCRRPMSCSDNQTIQYPFHIEHRQPNYCGYPGFTLKCHPNGHPILHLYGYGRDLFVRSISYENHTVRLSHDAVLTPSGCRFLIGNLSLPDEPFRLAASQGGAEICDTEASRSAAERNGLLVKWTAGECRFCNQSGGFCGFDFNTHLFKCYCPDRPHAFRCNPPPPPG